MRFNKYLRYLYSDMSGQLFKLSVAKGYDSLKFMEIALITPYGQRVYNDMISSEWLADTYLMEGYERQFKDIPRGKTIAPEIMYFIGYIYRYWAITDDVDIAEIYKIAPPTRLINKYGFYHTQSEEYVINDLKRIAIEAGITI